MWAALVFFCAGRDFRPGFLDHFIDVALHQRFGGEVLALEIAVNGLLHGGGLIARHIAGDVFAVFWKLVVEIRAIGAVADNGEFATFQMRNLGGLCHL